MTSMASQSLYYYNHHAAACCQNVKSLHLPSIYRPMDTMGAAEALAVAVPTPMLTPKVGRIELGITELGTIGLRRPSVAVVVAVTVRV